MSDFVLTPPPSGSESPQPIEIRFNPAYPVGFEAVVELCGEHDLASAVEVQDALEMIHGNVLVDLTRCSFVDSTIIGVLIVDQKSRLCEGHRLELLVPPDNKGVTRTLEVSGVPRLVTIHTAYPNGEQLHV